jgi:hypothetical protein
VRRIVNEMHHLEYPEEKTGLVTHIQAYEAEVVSVGQSAHGAPLKRLEKLWMFYRYLVDRGVMNSGPWGGPDSLCKDIELHNFDFP